MILAWPGVIVSVLLIGVCAYFFFPYGWTWAQCLLFGAVLSATDPVAILAGLHEVRRLVAALAGLRLRPACLLGLGPVPAVWGSTQRNRPSSNTGRGLHEVCCNNWWLSLSGRAQAVAFAQQLKGGSASIACMVHSATDPVAVLAGLHQAQAVCTPWLGFKLMSVLGLCMVIVPRKTGFRITTASW